MEGVSNLIPFLYFFFLFLLQELSTVCELHLHVVQYQRGHHSCPTEEILVSTVICNVVKTYLFMSMVMEITDCQVHLLMDGSTEAKGKVHFSVGLFLYVVSNRSKDEQSRSAFK
jgi:hypothetical protein